MLGAAVHDDAVSGGTISELATGIPYARPMSDELVRFEEAVLAQAPPGSIVVGSAISPDGSYGASLTILPSATDYPMDDLFERTGGCLCGAVRYTVRGDPVHVGRCHCTDCRKESGSAFTVYAQWPVEAFELSGEMSSYDGRGFCPRCGSRLLNPADPGDTLVEIRIGSLDEAPFELKPEREIWVKRRESWLPPVEGAAQYDES